MANREVSCDSRWRELSAAENQPVNNLSFDEIQEFARAEVWRLGNAVGDEFELMLDRTAEVTLGWVFFFNSAEFIRTREITSSLAGNGPIFVSREGVIHHLPSRIPWQEALQQLGLI